MLFATKTAMRTLGRRVLVLDQEKAELDELLSELVATTGPELLGLHGVGIDTAAILLTTAGDNPERLRSEAAWAHLCGVAPIEASSGKVVRRRLNRAVVHAEIWPSLVDSAAALDIPTNAGKVRDQSAGGAARVHLRHLDDDARLVDFRCGADIGGGRGGVDPQSCRTLGDYEVESVAVGYVGSSTHHDMLSMAM